MSEYLSELDSVAGKLIMLLAQLKLEAERAKQLINELRVADEIKTEPDFSDKLFEEAREDKHENREIR